MQANDTKTLTCFYSGKKSTIEELKVMLDDFHKMDGVKGNGEKYCFFTDGEYYRLAVNTWTDNAWKVIVE